MTFIHWINSHSSAIYYNASHCIVWMLDSKIFPLKNISVTLTDQLWLAQQFILLLVFFYLFGWKTNSWVKFCDVIIISSISHVKQKRKCSVLPLKCGEVKTHITWKYLYKVQELCCRTVLKYSTLWSFRSAEFPRITSEWTRRMNIKVQLFCHQYLFHSVFANRHLQTLDPFPEYTV